MLDALKPLLVVLVLSFAVFKVVQPICFRFMEPRDFFRRRNVWWALTSLTFLTPNFWIFACLALVLVYWAGKVDRHPTAIYAMLVLCVPPADLWIPVPFINQLFALSTPRILALGLVVPACIRLSRTTTNAPRGTASVVALFLVAYCALQLALFVDFESYTNTLRRAFLFAIDTYALYFLFSRGIANRESLRDTLACLWLSCAVQVPIVVFESAKGWLLYEGVGGRWGVPNYGAFLLRGDSLRGQGSAGHSLTMGFMLAIAFGVWLSMSDRAGSKRLLILIGAGIWAGLISTYSRAPWIVAAFIFVAYTIFGPGGKQNILKTLLGGIIILAVVSVTPFGEKLFALLPFIGTQDQGNVDYREQLATVSWQLIKEHPWFGSPYALGQMEELRQGQGIIDLVNTFAAVALFYGGVGVTLFTACFLLPLVRTFAALRKNLKVDVELQSLGAVLVSCMLGTLLMMATASFGNAFEQTAWMLAGLCSAYPLIKASEVSVVAKPLFPQVPRPAFS